MSRRIRTQTLQAMGGGAAPPDSYTDKIVKLVPADVVAAWLAVTTALKSAKTPLGTRGLWVIFFVGVIFAALWTWKKASAPGETPPYTQTAISTIAFVVWAYATGGDSPMWPGSIYNPLWATLLLVAFSLASGLVSKA